jgi:Zn-dependent M28 family amino/carboxypeptidase
MRRFVIAAVAALCVGAPALAAPGDRALDDVRILSADDMGGRGIGTEGSSKARAYIAGRFGEMGLAVVEQPFAFTRKSDGKEVHGVNLIAAIPGAESSERVLVITAHYDHLGTRDGVVFNGADDNASGVAALLALAETFKAYPPRHMIVFAVLDGEESGQRGARAFVESPPTPLPRIALVVNLDMLSRSAKGELHVAGASHFPWLEPRLRVLVDQVPITLKLGHDTDADGEQNNWTLQSDHGAFHAKGVPWVYFGVEDHPDYHKASDDFATVPGPFFQRVIAAMMVISAQFDEDLDAMAAEAGR